MVELSNRITEEQLREMMKTADTDGDGKIVYAEFIKVFSAQG